jgi:hypothetical protein
MSGKRFLLYTTEPGGLFKFAPGDPKKEFERAKWYGKIDATPNDVDRSEGFVAEYVEPTYVALVEIIDDFDFQLGHPRSQ